MYLEVFYEISKCISDISEILIVWVFSDIKEIRIFDIKKSYWRGLNYRKEFAVYRLFCNKNQEKHRKNTRRLRLTQALSDSIILFVSKFKV